MVDFHKRILFSDEAHFWLNGYVNKQNCRIWSEANPQVYVETPLHPEKTDCLVRFMDWWNPSSKSIDVRLQSGVVLSRSANWAGWEKYKFSENKVVRHDPVGAPFLRYLRDLYL
ncbi:uncharacterized protein TNCV_4814821 [Trichonephila clavipes]|nr:uncharacterized protein TNCV_4814821 [Trichonephila clavipes]